MRDFSVETLKKLIGRSQSNGLDNILEYLLNEKVDQAELDEKYATKEDSIFSGKFNLNGIEIIHRETKPYLRPDGTQLVVGDRWFKMPQATEWLWNGVAWVSSTLRSISEFDRFNEAFSFSFGSNSTNRYKTSGTFKYNGVFVEDMDLYINIISGGTESNYIYPVVVIESIFNSSWLWVGDYYGAKILAPQKTYNFQINTLMDLNFVINAYGYYPMNIYPQFWQSSGGSTRFSYPAYTIRHRDAYQLSS